MKMERKFSRKVKDEGCSHWQSVIVQVVKRKLAILECYLLFRQYIYALWFFLQFKFWRAGLSLQLKWSF